MAEFMNYDLNGLLTEEEQKKLFEEPETPEVEDGTPPEEIENEETEEEPVEDPEKNEDPERVDGTKTIEHGEDATKSRQGTGSSPSVYPSIARAFKKDNIFPDFDESELDAATTPEAFAELVEKAVNSRVESQLDETTKRVNEALLNGVKPDEVRACESTIAYLDDIDDTAIEDGTDDGEALRRKLIFNDLLLKGYTEDQARRKVETSFKTDSDVDDAKDALAALKAHWNGKYDKLRRDAKERVENARKEQKQQIDKFKKMLLEDEVKLGETKLDKKTCQRAYDAVMTPTHQDPETKQYLTEVQKFQKENPLEFMKQLGLWFVLTDGGKNLTGFTSRQVNEAKNKGIRELEQKLQGSSLHADGSLNLVGGGHGSADPLLSDEWNVGWSK